MKMKMKLGLYKVFWKSGGYSLASIGQDHDGNLWVAPCNWTGKNLDGKVNVAFTDQWENISHVRLIETA